MDSAGHDTLVRWSAVPVQPFVAAESSPKDADKNFLFKDLLAQLKAGTLEWHLVFTVAAPGDPSDGATVAWPGGRRQVDGGFAQTDAGVAEDAGLCTDSFLRFTGAPRGDQGVV